MDFHQLNTIYLISCILKLCVNIIVNAPDLTFIVSFVLCDTTITLVVFEKVIVHFKS